ncbi:MAG: acid phosphatase [Xanthomonadales bacterium]|nr:acid phosphatase [Xanthomonadales bacterium]
MRLIPLMPRAALLPLLLCVAACATAPKPKPEGGSAPAVEVVAPNLAATAWMQASQEYRGAVRGTFAAAARQLETALAQPDWDALPPSERVGLPMQGLPAAVIVDADETMIDNSPYQARNIRDERGYSLPSWQAWVAESKARALPGALDFARHAERLGVTVFFVTNRAHDPERAPTVANLRALGFPVREDGSNVILQGDPRAPGEDKGTRRRWVGERYRVLLMLGDNLGDFIDGSRADHPSRNALIAPYESWWGERWFMLPNPSYGSWESAIRRACDRSIPPARCMRDGLRHD